MIHVQIASQITTTGVHGVRWVLLDSNPADDGPGVAAPGGQRLIPSADDAGAGPAAAPPPMAPAGRPIGLIKLLVISLALGVALWLAQAWLGPLAQRAGPARTAPVPHMPAPQRAAPLRPASAVPLMTVVRR